MKTYVIKAAGGNPTAIKTIKSELTRQEYEKFGNDLMLETQKLDVEQVGFLVQKKDFTNHFEMSGGEFCGNASRSAALIISLLTGKQENFFTVSGFQNTVSSRVEKVSDVKFNVTCEFPDLPVLITSVIIDGIEAKVVDLGGIVHVVIDAPFPKDGQKEQHQKIVEELFLTDRDAVGVIWVYKTQNGVGIEPVVWVKSIDTYFHETSCGSGTIAVTATTGERSILQPSGQTISATVSDSKVILTSEMEIVFEA
jgi:histidine racemase